MQPTDRLVLIDLENVVGFRPKPRTLRARVTALLEAAAPWHHAVAAYAVDDAEDDPTASVLACLGVAPLRVAPGPDTAETALLAHARRMHADEECAVFTVCSCDRAFAALADIESVRVEVLIWQGQPVSAKLQRAADEVRQLPRPGTEHSLDEVLTQARTTENDEPVRRQQHRPVRPALSSLATGILTGIGLALGHRLVDVLLPQSGTRACGHMDETKGPR